MVLEVVRKWEYKTRQSNGSYTYETNKPTISEFKLKLDDEIVKDSNNQEIKGYMIEPAGVNPNIDKSANEQQKTAGSDTRIPAGEYEVFWRKATKRVKKNGEFLGKLPVELRSGFVPGLRAINGTDMGKRQDILIHIGNTGKDTLGCLMPNKTYTNNVASGSVEMTEKLIGAIIRHDPQSYINATKTHIRTNENAVKNFIIKITEQIIK